MNYLRQLFDWCFNKPICAFADWYDCELARERARKPTRRERRAIQREIQL